MTGDTADLPEGYERTLHSANAGLNVFMALAVVIAAAYAMWGRGGDVREWQRWFCGAGALIAVLWGGYYARFRVRVDTAGISFRAIRSRFFPWRQLVTAHVEEFDRQGVASCCIVLTFSPGGTVRISSDVLDLEDVRTLADELRSMPFFRTVITDVPREITVRH